MTKKTNGLRETFLSIKSEFITEAVVQRCSVKKIFLDKIQRKTPVSESLF